jgi:hypothetical protein
MIPTNKTEHKRLRIEPRTKFPQNSPKQHKNQSSQEKEINITMNASIQPEVRFSTKISRKSSLKSREMRTQSGWMSCPEIVELYMKSLRVGQMTKLPLQHKGRYTPLRGNMVKT